MTFVARQWSKLTASKSRVRKHKRQQQRKLALESLEGRRVMAAAILNEVSQNPIGGDQPYEFVEIKGVPGASANGLYFASIDGDGGAAGSADFVADLSGFNFGSNGLLFIGASLGSYNGISPETTFVPRDSLNAGDPGPKLENGSNTFTLIQSLVNPIVQDTDYDEGNTGVLTLPEGAIILDAISLLDNPDDNAYGTILTQESGFFDAATRFRNDNRANTVDAWYSGDLLNDAGPDSFEYQTDPTRRSANFPTSPDGAVSPGRPNIPGTNSGPVGFADAYEVEPGSTLEVSTAAGVLSNDTDADGVNDLLFATLVMQPVNGTVELLEDGSFTYVNNGTTGSDTFTYFASDLEDVTLVITVTIEVETSSNVAPVLTVPEGPVSFIEDTGALLIADGTTVVDSDSPNFGNGSLTVELTAGATADDRLVLLSEGNAAGEVDVTGDIVSYEGVVVGLVSGGIGNDPLIVAFNFEATVAAVEAITGNVQFDNVSGDPVSTLRTASFTLNDGASGNSISNTETVDITVTAVNDAPVLALPVSSATYSIGDGEINVAGSLLVSDVDSPNFDGGNLTASQLGGAVHPMDELSVRSIGTGAGQISVSGSDVLYEGTVVGTVSGGTAGAALVVTLNSSATVAAAQELGRSIVFSTSDQRFTPAARTITLGIDDGDGDIGSGDVTVTQSFVRQYAYQNGVVNSKGLYAGTADVALAEAAPDEAFSEGRFDEGLLIDFDVTGNASQVLLRFDDLVGSGLGQVPANAQIVSARLIVDTNNPGDGGTFHRMISSFDQTAATWNSFGGGVQADDVEAVAQFETQIGVATGSSDTRNGNTIIQVTKDIQAWVDGAANEGWLMQGWDGRTNGWAISSSEAVDLADRPRLEVEWLPATTANNSFRDGDSNGYAGTLDTGLIQENDIFSLTEDETLFIDARSPGDINEAHVLLRFEDTIGTDSATQVPAGALVHAAIVELAGVAGNAQGAGGTFHQVQQSWTDTETWSGVGQLPFNGTGGLQADGVDLAIVSNAAAGNPEAGLLQEAGFNNYNVTADFQTWVSGIEANNGWGLIPYEGLTDGWGIGASENSDFAARPGLRVYYTPVGVSVDAAVPLEVSESGSTATFSVKLDTPPTEEVTIGVSSSDLTEGTVSTSSLVFTPENWDEPQIVTVTGVDDSDIDGDVTFQIDLADAVSSDPNYDGFVVAGVSVVTVDNDTDSPTTVTGVQFGDGTTQRSIVDQIDISFDGVVTFDTAGFVLEQRVGGAFQAIPASELTISAIDVGTSSASLVRLTFSGSSVLGGSLADGNYRLTLQSSLIQSNGADLDGDDDGTAGGDFVRGELETDDFFRLYGDADGNGFVNIFETNRFRQTIGSSTGGASFDARYDSDGNGFINIFDTNRFRQQIGKGRGF
jgi:hypothetical protein